MKCEVCDYTTDNKDEMRSYRAVVPVDKKYDLGFNVETRFQCQDKQACYRRRSLECPCAEPFDGQKPYYSKSGERIPFLS